MRRRQWFDWHSWVGVSLSLLLTFTLFTGTLATISREIDWLFTPAMRAEAALPASELPWAAMMANFEATFPEARPQFLLSPTAPWFAPELFAQTPDGERFRVFFDAMSGQVRGTAVWFNWQRFLREAHRHLMLPINIGLTVVGLLSLPLLVSAISSLVIYRHWWRGFFRLPRLALHASSTASAPEISRHAVSHRRRFWGDLHRLAGVWSLWFIVLIAVTGIWYLAERWGLAATYPTVAAPKGGDAGSLVSASPTPTLEELLADAKQAYPELVVTAIRFDASERIWLQGQAEAWLVRDRANHVVYHRPSGQRLDVRKGEDFGWHARISEAADPLHFGTFGGTITRYLWGLFGLLLTLLSASGVYLYGLRLVASHRSQAPNLQPLQTAIRGLPPLWSLPSGLVIVTCVALGLWRWLAA